MTRITKQLVALMLVVAPLTVVSALAVEAGGPSAIATFNGRTIDLSQGWAGAQACVALADRTECFGSEPSLLDAHPELRDIGNPTKSTSTLASTLALPLSATATSCSSSLALYRGTSFSGSVLFLTTRFAVLNLSLYGFDNDTSSYKIGACSGSFYSSSNAGGSVYPGNTAAGASSTVMSPGWDNVVSSVYIN
jgi:hypothetical protein